MNGKNLSIFRTLLGNEFQSNTRSLIFICCKFEKNWRSFAKVCSIVECFDVVKRRPRIQKSSLVLVFLEITSIGVVT